MSVTSGGTAPKPLSSGGRSSAAAGSAGISITFRIRQRAVAVAALAVPHPDRRREILQAGDDADEAVGLVGIVRGPQLEHHLLLGAEVELLQVRAAVEIPHVQRVAVLARQQQLRVHAVLHHVRRAPLAGDHRVVAEVPPEVVGEVLRSAIALPAALDLERLGVEHEDAAGAVAVAVAERVDVDPVGPAVRGVRAAVAGLRGSLRRPRSP